jgi:hypothetical protein
VNCSALRQQRGTALSGYPFRAQLSRNSCNSRASCHTSLARACRARRSSHAFSPQRVVMSRERSTDSFDRDARSRRSCTLRRPVHTERPRADRRVRTTSDPRRAGPNGAPRRPFCDDGTSDRTTGRCSTESPSRNRPAACWNPGWSRCLAGRRTWSLPGSWRRRLGLERSRALSSGARAVAVGKDLLVSDTQCPCRFRCGREHVDEARCPQRDGACPGP